MFYILFHFILKHYNVLLCSVQGQRKDDFHIMIIKQKSFSLNNIYIFFQVYLNRSWSFPFSRISVYQQNIILTWKFARNKILKIESSGPRSSATDQKQITRSSSSSSTSSSGSSNPSWSTRLFLEWNVLLLGGFKILYCWLP